MQRIAGLMFFLGIAYVRERMLESLEKGELESVHAYLTKSGGGGGGINHIQ